MTKKLRTGLIGHGRMGANLARNICIHPGFEMAAICDANAGIENDLTQTDYRTARFTTHADDIFRDPTIDVVVIATLPDSHYELTKAALMAGKHVLVEKPISQNVQQAEELAALAKAKNLKLMVDHTLLYEEAAKDLQREMASGRYGKAKEFEFARIQPLCTRLFHRHCFEELAPHVFSVLDMLDNYASQRTEIQWLEGDLERGVKARLKTSSGLEGTVHFAFRNDISPMQEERRTIVTFHPKRLGQHEEVTHTASWDERRDPLTREQKITITDQEGRIRREIKTGKNLPLTAVINDLHDAITQDREPISNGQTSVRVMQMMDGIVKSRAMGGEKVSVDMEPLRMTSPARAIVG